MKITHSKTVNIIKVTTRAHSDAPQPMNVSLERISSSSGLHCHRGKNGREICHIRGVKMLCYRSWALLERYAMNFTDSNKKKNAPLAPSNSWVLQNWWCGYKDMKWHQERQRSPCSPRWTSCWWDSAWRKHRSCKYTLIPGKVSIFNLKVLCFWLTLCWNSKRHRQDCCSGNILSKETTVDLITLYFLHVNTSDLI